MLARTIPSSGEALPVIGLGTWQTFDVPAGRSNVRTRGAVIQALFASGGTLIDCSPMYGQAEAMVGAALNDRQRAFLATKIWTTGKDAGTRQLQTSFELMGAGDTLDLVQVHNLVDWRTHLTTLRTWQARQQVRYIGITHYTVAALDDLAQVIHREKIDFVQLVYSLETRAAEHSVLQLAQDKGVAVIANMPFGTGTAFKKVRGRALPEWAADIGVQSWAQFMLKYVISHPAVTCVIPATSNAAHMEDNARAGAGPLPDEAMRRRMAEFWDAM
jgi:diketogulonate reductase-like aldo/keto reductase